MKIITISILAVLFNAPAFAIEGPYTSEEPILVRASTSSHIQVFGTPASANCYKNKAVYPEGQNEDISAMILSIALAAQVSKQNVNFWVERYDSTTPQRCLLKELEIVN